MKLVIFFVLLLILCEIYLNHTKSQSKNIKKISNHKHMRHNNKQRIVGGHEARIEDYPFVAALVVVRPDKLEFHGGASIISKYWVLTAAHVLVQLAIEDINNGQAFVHSNSALWNKDYTAHRIDRRYSHDGYNWIRHDYDIAIVHVTEPFTGKYEIPIKFPEETYNYIDDSVADVLGWGMTYGTANNSPTVDHVRIVDIKLINFDKCAEIHRRHRKILTIRMLCAGSKGKDACANDSGGPLVQNNTLIGLVSGGYTKCGDISRPGVYTRVCLFNYWIKDVMHNTY